MNVLIWWSFKAVNVLRCEEYFVWYGPSLAVFCAKWIDLLVGMLLFFVYYSPLRQSSWLDALAARGELLIASIVGWQPAFLQDLEDT